MKIKYLQASMSAELWIGSGEQALHFLLGVHVEILTSGEFCYLSPLPLLSSLPSSHFTPISVINANETEYHISGVFMFVDKMCFHQNLVLSTVSRSNIKLPLLASCHLLPTRGLSSSYLLN